MTISLPDPMRERQRRKDREILETLLLEGLNSGQPIEVAAEYLSKGGRTFVKDCSANQTINETRPVSSTSASCRSRFERSLRVSCPKKIGKKALLFDQAAFDTFERLCDMPLIGTKRKFSNADLQGICLWFVKDFEKYLIFL